MVVVGGAGGSYNYIVTRIERVTSYARYKNLFIIIILMIIIIITIVIIIIIIIIIVIVV